MFALDSAVTWQIFSSRSAAPHQANTSCCTQHRCSRRALVPCVPSDHRGPIGSLRSGCWRVPRRSSGVPWKPGSTPLLCCSPSAVPRACASARRLSERSPGLTQKVLSALALATAHGGKFQSRSRLRSSLAKVRLQTARGTSTTSSSHVSCRSWTGRGNGRLRRLGPCSSTPASRTEPRLTPWLSASGSSRSPRSRRLTLSIRRWQAPRAPAARRLRMKLRPKTPRR
mmetsp:Transcript_91966/g.297603  ORF Transcript_91966/g.297603 Transcript_91966/m.297603 type:complete len:227 (-) Transcript_91966:1501-2181(-)